MENSNKKELINELQRAKELMYGKEIINEQLSSALRNILMKVLRTSIDEIIRTGMKSASNIASKLKGSFDDIVKRVSQQSGQTLTQAEKNLIAIELDKVAQKEAENAVKNASKVADDAARTVKTAGGDAAKTVKNVGDDASKKAVTNTKPTGSLKYPPALVKKGADVTDNVGNVIIKNGQVTDLTPAIVKSESGVPKILPGVTDDVAKPYFRQFVGAFDEPTAQAATGAVKKGSTLVGKMTEATKNVLIKLGILKNVGGKLTISWKRVLLYSLLFGVGYSVVANWFKDNGVTPVKDPKEPIVNQDPAIVDPVTGSQDGGTSGSINTVVSKSTSGENRYTFDFAAVMAALQETGKCPTGYGTAGTAGTAGTTGTSGTSGIITEPDTTLSSDEYYEYMSS